MRMFAERATPQTARYDPATLPTQYHMSNMREERQIGAVQTTLMTPLDDANADSIAQLKRKLHSYNKKPLSFVWHSLNLPEVVACGGREVPTSTKEHFVELLVNWRLRMPLHADPASASPLTNPNEVLSHIRHVIKTSITPTTVRSVPYNYGNAAAGTIKADEWRTLGTLYIPVALMTLWNDQEGSAPPHNSPHLKVLDHSMALFQAVEILCRHTMSLHRATTYRSLLREWVDGLYVVHPKTYGHKRRPNVHAAFHIYDFLVLFGPVMSWWTFPFERMIGALQKINTCGTVGGPLEASMLKAWIRGANLRRWLRRPNCPEVIRQFKYLFDKTFSPGQPLQVIPEPSTSDHEVAYYTHKGSHFARASTHRGNSQVFYYPTSDSTSSIVGSIQKILIQHDGKAICHIQRL